MSCKKKWQDKSNLNLFLKYKKKLPNFGIMNIFFPIFDSLIYTKCEMVCLFIRCLWCNVEILLEIGRRSVNLKDDTLLFSKNIPWFKNSCQKIYVNTMPICPFFFVTFVFVVSYHFSLFVKKIWSLFLLFLSVVVWW